MPNQFDIITLTDLHTRTGAVIDGAMAGTPQVVTKRKRRILVIAPLNLRQPVVVYSEHGNHALLIAPLDEAVDPADLAAVRARLQQGGDRGTENGGGDGLDRDS